MVKNFCLILYPNLFLFSFQLQNLIMLLSMRLRFPLHAGTQGSINLSCFRHLQCTSISALMVGAACMVKGEKRSLTQCMLPPLKQMRSTDETNYPIEMPFSLRLDGQISCRQQNLRKVNLHRLQVFTTYSSEAAWVKLWLNLLKKEPSMKLIETAGFRHASQEGSSLFFTLHQQMLVGGWKLLPSHCRVCATSICQCSPISAFRLYALVSSSVFQGYLEFILLPHKQITWKKEC